MLRSSTYIDEPVIRRGSSLRRTSAPTNRLRTMGALLLRRPAPIAAQALALGQTTEHSTVHDAIPGPAQPLWRRFVHTKGYSGHAPDVLVLEETPGAALTVRPRRLATSDIVSPCVRSVKSTTPYVIARSSSRWGKLAGRLSTAASATAPRKPPQNMTCLSA